MKKVSRYLLPFWKQIIAIFILIAINVWTTLQLPNIMAGIINEGIIHNDWNIIVSKCWQMLLIAIIGMISSILATLIASQVTNKFANNVRSALFNHIENFALPEINQFSTASLITRTTNDIQQVQQAIYLILRMSLQAPMIAVGAIFSALNSEPHMAWIMGVSVAVLLTVVIAIFSAVMPKFKIQQKLIDRINQVARENLTGLRVIRAFNNESAAKKKFDDVNTEATKLNLWINRIVSIMQPGMTLIISFTMLGIVWFGAKLISTSDTEIGNIIAFMQYAMQVITSFLILVMLMIFLPRAKVSSDRINEILLTETSINEPANPDSIDLSKIKGVLEFKDVSFSYPGAEQPVLNSVDLVAQPGKITAIIGSTGSGKSTMANLIARLYDVSAGQITIDGHDIRHLSNQDRTSLISIAPQKANLFSGTVASNIKFGGEAKQSDIEKAARIAQADFIDELKGKYKSDIAQGGSNVSGGQKQRLSIARAIARKAKIFVFDDSFSALDYQTDKKLRQALIKNFRDRTIVIVAQRIATIRHADQILVLDNGSIVGQGTHQELLRNNEVYLEIAKSQLSESEVKTDLEVK